MNRFAFYLVLALGVLIDATGHDGYGFISIAALAFALEQRAAA